MPISKQQLQQYAQILRWEPTSQNVDDINGEIRRLIDEGARISITNLQAIITNYCPEAQVVVVKGVDNSDLNTLLDLATKK